MNRYINAVLIVCGMLFLILFGLALLPIMVALLGMLGGIVVAFAPLFIGIIAVIIVARILKKDSK